MLTSTQRFVAAAIQDGKIEHLLKHGPVAHLFMGDDKKLWEYVDGHVKKYGTLPHYELLKADTGFDLCTQPQPAEFYLDRAREHYIQQELLGTFQTEYDKNLKGGQGMKPSDALQSIAQTVMKLATQQMGAAVVDYRDAYDIVMKAFVAKMAGGNEMGLQFGWPTLDQMTGGMSIGDLISFVGRPASGKTWLMLFLCLYAWEVQNKVPLFVSMEIKPLPVQQRLLAIDAHLPAKGIREGQLSTEEMKIMRKVLKENKGKEVPFHIVDGNLTATVNDIYALTRQLKPDFVVIDGAYLLAHPTEKDRYRRVAENCNLLKKQIADLCPTICSWQFARPKKDGKKTKTPEQQTLDDIGYTDAVGQDSSLICGLMQPDSVETTNERKVSILKGRNGETGSFRIKWDFNWTTDFSEIVPPGEGDDVIDETEEEFT